VNWWNDPQQRRGLGLALGLALLAHVAVLTQLQARQGGGMRGLPTLRFQLRWIAAPELPAPAVANPAGPAPAPAVLPAPGVVPGPTAASPAASPAVSAEQPPAPPAPAVVPVAPAAAASRPATVTARQSAPAPQAAGPTEPATVAEDEEATLVPGEPPYLPRKRLTVVPEPLAPVDVPFPPDVTGIVQLRVQLSLFIDETGTVRRVQLDTPQVPASFARSVVETFVGTRFSPGELDHVPVRSHIKVEVEFSGRGGR
jgi:hypothetical protein